MTISASAANFTRQIFTADASPDLALPTSVPAGATIVVGILNRTDTTTDITDVTDSVNAGSYTRASALGSDFSALYYFLNSSSGTPTVTVTFAGTINSQIAIGWFEDSTHGAMTVDSVMTPRDAGANETDIDTTPFSVSGAGAIIGFAGGNNSQADPEPVADGAGETELLTGAAGLRIGMFFEAFASAGSYGFETTWDSSQTDFHVIAFLEPGGGGGGEVAGTPMQNLFSTFGPARAARLGGVLQ